MAKQHFHDYFGGEAQVGDIADLVILLDNPNSVTRLASRLDETGRVTEHYEFHTVSGNHDGIDISICSTGIGGGSATICVDTLATLGAKTFIYFGIGTTSGADLDAVLSIALGAIRLDGASLDYVEAEFPAVADPEVIMALSHTAREHRIPQRLGIFLGNAGPLSTEAKKSFEAYNSRLRDKGGDYTYPIVPATPESATIMTLSTLYQIRSGAMFAAVADQEGVIPMEERLFDLALQSLSTLHRWDQEKAELGWKLMTPLDAEGGNKQ